MIHHLCCNSCFPINVLHDRWSRIRPKRQIMARIATQLAPNHHHSLLPLLFFIIITAARCFCCSHTVEAGCTFATVCRSLKIDAAHSPAAERRFSLCRRRVPRRTSGSGIHQRFWLEAPLLLVLLFFSSFVHTQASPLTRVQNKLRLLLRWEASCTASNPGRASVDRNRDSHPHIIREMEGEGRGRWRAAGSDSGGEERREEEEENVSVTLWHGKPHVSSFVVFLWNWSRSIPPCRPHARALKVLFRRSCSWTENVWFPPSTRRWLYYSWRVSSGVWESLTSALIELTAVEGLRPLLGHWEHGYACCFWLEDTSQVLSHAKNEKNKKEFRSPLI